MDQVSNVRINQPLFWVLFRHKGIVYINVTLKVKTVLMFLLRVASIAVQPEIATNDCNNTAKVYSRIKIFSSFVQSITGNKLE